MLSEWETNTVLISGLLQQRHPEIVRRLESILAENEIPLVTVPGMADIWIRDAAPVQVDDLDFTQFCYCPDYLRKGYRKLITKPEVFERLVFLGQPRRSKLIIDAGNIVGTRSTAVLTDKILWENSKSKTKDVADELRRLLRVEKLILIPQEKFDEVGHADGMLRFLADDQVILNDYRRIDARFAKRVEASLTHKGIAITRIPYVPEHRIHDGIPSAVGNYANFLRVKNLIIVPAYGLPEDEAVRGILANLLPQCRVVSLPCRNLAEEGGVLNCASWTIQQSGGRTD